jgi:hypothetical protein
MPPQDQIIGAVMARALQADAVRTSKRGRGAPSDLCGLHSRVSLRSLTDDLGGEVMDAGTTGRGVLQASIWSVELGLFRVVCRNPPADIEEDDLPKLQLGKDVSEAKRRFEVSAQALGYDTVAWEDVASSPR